jgi:hypothetical protein
MERTACNNYRWEVANQSKDMRILKVRSELKLYRVNEGVIILGGISIAYCEKISWYEHVSHLEWLRS